jgi:DNA-binding GntR family transcriptional regulator
MTVTLQTPEITLPKPADNASQIREAVETLEEEIAFGYIHPRERLIEDDLLSRFGLKRHVVRQVLAELEKRGLIERKKNIGALVKSYTIKEVIDLYAVREILETSCIRQIEVPPPADKIDRLIAIQREHDAGAAEAHLHQAFRANLAFHKTLFELCDNVVLRGAIEDFALRAHPIRSFSMVFPSYLEKARVEHWEMIDALRRGDRDRLVELHRIHLLPSRDAYVAQQRQYAKTK